MYSIFEKLCKERNVTPYRVGKETGITTATFSHWKKGNYTPKQEKLEKIANYFGVSLDYLITGEEQKSNFDTENAELLLKIHKDTKLLAALEKYFELPDDRKKLIVDNINMLSGGEK